ncbi:MAG: hypothetical protein FWF78_02835 [Defluviitaleaceae bacterium]|nr:hypothetical protein [Defluviitaleaceae bacterium]
MTINPNQNILWQPINQIGTGSKPVFDPMEGINAPIILKGCAIVSGAMRLPGGGWLNAHVFKSENSTPENPIMLVKGTNTCGSPFEAEVSINDLNKNSMSFIEMFALDGYITSNTGKTSSIAREAGRALMFSDVVTDGFTTFDIIPALKEAIAMHRQNGNWDAVNSINNVMDSIFGHFGRNRGGAL